MRTKTLLNLSLIGLTLLTTVVPFPNHAADAPKKINVLLVTGDDVGGHPWAEVSQAIKETLVDSKRFEVRVCEDAGVLDSAASLARYDLIFLHYYNAKTPTLSDQAKENLLNFVKGGKGFAVSHLSSASFKEWPEFGKLCGRYWVMGKSGHGPRSTVGSRHVRNAASLGGNLNLPTRCWYTNQSETWRQARPPCFKTGGDVCFVIRSAKECFALNSVDSAPALMTLNARVTMAGAAGTREVSLSEFYRDDGLAPTVLGPAEIVTAVHVPAHRDRTAFIKIAQRTGLDYGLGTIAAAITGNNRRVTSARLVVGSVASRPVSLQGSARVIEQGGLTPHTIDPTLNVTAPSIAQPKMSSSLTRQGSASKRLLARHTSSI